MRIATLHPVAYAAKDVLLFSCQPKQLDRPHRAGRGLMYLTGISLKVALLFRQNVQVVFQTPIPSLIIVQL